MTPISTTATIPSPRTGKPITRKVRHIIPAPKSEPYVAHGLIILNNTPTRVRLTIRNHWKIS